MKQEQTIQEKYEECGTKTVHESGCITCPIYYLPNLWLEFMQLYCPITACAIYNKNVR